jgi:hypothetical protein
LVLRKQFTSGMGSAVVITVEVQQNQRSTATAGERRTNLFAYLVLKSSAKYA